MFSDDLMTTGIPLSAAGDRMMNSETRPSDDREAKQKESFVKKIYNFQSITGHDILLKFWIKSQFEYITEITDLKTKLMDTWYAPFFYWGWILFEGTVLCIASVAIGVARLTVPGYLAAERTAALAEKQIRLGEKQLDAARKQLSDAAVAATQMQGQVMGTVAEMKGQVNGIQGQAHGTSSSILDTLTKTATGAVKSIESSASAATAATATATAAKARTSSTSGLRELVHDHMKGGARVSDEGQILGATVLALVAGGGLKALIDYIVSE